MILSMSPPPQGSLDLTFIHSFLFHSTQARATMARASCYHPQAPALKTSARRHLLNVTGVARVIITAAPTASG